MNDETYPFVMRSLPYEYYALAPCISAESLTYHHDKIYKDYVDQLNLALANYPLLQKLSLRELLTHPENLPEGLQEEVKKNGGGAFSHELFFDSMQPLGREQDPKGALLEAIIRDFGSLRDFRERISEAAAGQYASGYAWLVLNRDGRLSVTTTPNQDVPDLKNVIPLLNVDIWEHSYYLQYQNRRRDYLNAWHRLINWRKVALRHEEAMRCVENERLLRGEGLWDPEERDVTEWNPEKGHAEKWNPEKHAENWLAEEGLTEAWSDEEIIPDEQFEFTFVP